MILQARILLKIVLAVVAMMGAVSCIQQRGAEQREDVSTIMDEIASTSSVFGRYVGLLKHTQVGRDQYAKFDLVYSRTDSDNYRLTGVLTLHFGDFGSREYVAYRFRDGKYSLLTGSLVFDESDQDLTVETEEFSGGRLVANLRSITSGFVGQLVLEKGGTATPARDVVDAVWGFYEGMCDDQETVLALNTYRSSSTVDSVIGNPFSTYGIQGRMGQRIEGLCPNASGRPCVTNVIYAGSYDFFTDRLTLTGEQRTLQCQVTDDGLACGSCEFVKTAADPAGTSGQDQPRSATSVLDSIASHPGTPAVDLEGEYTGYLHHEFLDQYQHAVLNLVTYQDAAGAATFRMSAAARLLFGERDGGQSLTYRFAPRSYDLLSPVFTFDGAADDADAMLQITAFNSEEVEGVWYSTQFGRVGTFKMSKLGLADLPADRVMMQSPSGRYESPDIEVVVAHRLGQVSGRTFDPFSPFVFGGHLFYHEGFRPRIDFLGGSYDYYTGRIAFLSEDNDRIAIGEIDNTTRALYLTWPSRHYGTLLHDWEHETFSYLGE